MASKLKKENVGVPPQLRGIVSAYHSAPWVRIPTTPSMLFHFSQICVLFVFVLFGKTKNKQKRVRVLEEILKIKSKALTSERSQLGFDPQCLRIRMSRADARTTTTETATRPLTTRTPLITTETTPPPTSRPPPPTTSETTPTPRPQQRQHQLLSMSK